MSSLFYYRRPHIQHPNNFGRSSFVHPTHSQNLLQLGVSPEKWQINRTRIIEITAAGILVFLLFSGISFVCLRPTLLEARSNIHSEWQLFVREVRERNDLLPGLLEAVRSFQPGFGKTSDRIMEARSAINRSSASDVIMPAVDQLDMHLRTIESIVNEKTELARHPSFGLHWQNVAKKNQEIAITRAHYNSSVRTYNYLLSVFPQAIFSSLFGYVRATEYPCPQNKGDQ